MIIFKKAGELSDYLADLKKKGSKTGLVPTMGALHNGHLSLIETARHDNDITVCSIFINPTQFNNPEDFKLYPVTIEKDIEQLVTSGCDVLFLPSVEEVYPAGFPQKHYDLGQLETILEGLHRPGHFQGVCQVVERLLRITGPHNLYLGQKDFQQCMVIAKLLQLTGMEKETHISILSTLREKDGLAMSSRNLRLTPEERKKAPQIFQELQYIRENLNRASLAELKKSAEDHLKQMGFGVDYIEIARVADLSPATDNSSPLVALAAASLGNVRLIDNLLLNAPSVDSKS